MFNFDKREFHRKQILAPNAGEHAYDAFDNDARSVDIW
jgi:hypothetical protein